MLLRRVFGVLMLGVLTTAAWEDASKNSQFNLTVAAPWTCVADKCKLRLTVSQVEGGFWFSMETVDKGYVALALAGSAMMGKDSVIECVKTSANAIEVFHSTNTGPPSTPGRGNSRDQPQNILSVARNITSSFREGRIFCSFILSSKTVFPNSTVDLMNTRYFLQIASGDNLNNTRITRHSRWATTLRPVSLVKDEGKLRTVDNDVPAPSSAVKLTTSVLMITMMLILR